jgi:hypothetical protein
MAGRLDRVQIAAGSDLVVIPWSSRDALLVELSRDAAMEYVVVAFRAVGASRPVELDSELRAGLLAAIDAWAGRADGALPEGVDELRAALR